ncbi:MAG: ORF6N domain-containing protein [Bacteroidota bacterium]
MARNNTILSIPDELIMNKILIVRGVKVMIDSDLAELYGVTTKRLNEQVKRNAKRFPADFMFQLTEQEKQQVVANCDHLERLKFSPNLPHVFTEHGAVMLASVLHSGRAILVNIQFVRVLYQNASID